MKEWLNGNSPEIRNSNSTRPWQHVLEALSGWTTANPKKNKNNCQSFNTAQVKLKI